MRQPASPHFGGSDEISQVPVLPLCACPGLGSRWDCTEQVFRHARRRRPSTTTAFGTQRPRPAHSLSTLRGRDRSRPRKTRFRRLGSPDGAHCSATRQLKTVSAIQILHLIASSLSRLSWRTSGRRGGFPPRLPRIRTCGLPASGSSDHGFAGRCAYTLWTTRGGGSGYRISKRLKRSHFIAARCERRSSQERQMRRTSYANRWSASTFPVIP